MDLSKIFFITDLDGTLLPTSKDLSERDKKAIKKFESDGGKFTVATGRTIQASKSYFDELEVKMPVILYNGSLILDLQKNEVLYKECLPECSQRIAEEIFEFMPDCGGEILSLDDILVVKNNEYEEEHMRICRVTPTYTTFDEAPRENWFKILFAMSPENILKTEEYIKKYEEVDFVRSADIFIEMLPKGSSKGKALKIYIEKLKLEGYTVIAAGDYHNDIEMLQYADIGVATANAQDAVKEAADIVLKNTSDECAIAELIDMIYNKEITLK